MASKKETKVINLQGIKQKNDAFVVIVKTEWNKEIVDVLAKDCMEVLRKHDIDVEVVTVPGAVEIPYIINKYYNLVKEQENDFLLDEEFLEDMLEEDYPEEDYRYPNAFIALGCVIKGDTAHFDYVCQSVTQGLALVNVNLPIPTINMVLTVYDEQQAKDRIGGKAGNKGVEAAETAIKMIDVIGDLEMRLF
jgi:6,7-dimethyl-8-ribityllumazine synthase